METGKRKRAPTSNGAAGDRKSARRDPVAASPPAVDDAEVDEFFAILRRMHEASSKCRAAAGAVRSSAGEGGAKWKPAFVWEDFEGGGAVTGGGGDDKAEEDRSRRCLDLNADPEPEGR